MGEELENQNIIEIICNDEDEVLKQKLKELLITICYGKEQEELNKGIEKKTDEQKAGWWVNCYFIKKSFKELKNYSHIFVYLNKEEKSVKKGFVYYLIEKKLIMQLEK